MWKMILENIIPIVVSTVVAPGLGFAVTYGVKWLRSVVDGVVARNQHNKGALLLQRLTYIVGTVVTEVEMTLRPHIKSALADGKISKEEGQNLKNIALDKIKSIVKESSLEELKAAMGIFDIDHLIEGMIETAVAGQKLARSGQALTTQQVARDLP